MRRAVPACLVAALIALPGAAHAQGGPPPTSQFEQLTLNDRPGEPVSLAVLPDRRVIHTARTGEVRIFNPRTQLNTLAADVPVYEHDEEGLQGVAVDPGFEENHWVYLYYSPPGDTPLDDPDTPDVNEGDAPFEGEPADFEPFKGVVRLSRFKLRGDELDLDSEQQIIDVPVDRGICCHVGGQIDFDSQGNLYLSTGDDTNPFQSDSYAPIDERPTRNPAFDAQRSSANTNDLRGKLLRIRVRPNGGYAIPNGNLFPRGTPKTRPEIYAMGLRNPFRFDVNPVNNHVYMADYSPDADEADPNRGPAGHGRWMIIKQPGNYGWPYCVTPELGYRDWDFATEQPGDWFNCTQPVNESPRNTGQRVLPPVVQPEVWYSYNPADTLFPELFENAVGGTGIGPMAGPAYQFEGGNPSVFKWPRYYHGQPLFYEWSRDYVKEMRLDRPNGGRLVDIRQVNIPLAPTWNAPGTQDNPVDNPMDMEFGPDGALYTIQYGDGFFSLNPDAKLTKINFVRGNRSPIPRVAAEGQPDPNVPLELLLTEDPTVQFSSAGTGDPDGDRITYAWDFDMDGEVDSREPNPEYTYEENGAFDATLTVTDRTGRKASASVPIIVGNKTPQVTLTTSPAPGETFQFGQQVSYTVTVVDDQPVDCSKVRVTYILGHDEHGHPLTSSLGCSGTITTSAPGHGDATNLQAVFNASYTDEPVDEGVPPLTGEDEVVIPPTG